MSRSESQPAAPVTNACAATTVRPMPRRFASALLRADAKRRGIGRTVVAAHAFVTGAAGCDSERDIRVGGIGDTPASVFDGLTYVALGHLHGQQDVGSGAAGATVRYCGSPLAFSFSERHHNKSVTLAEI